MSIKAYSSFGIYKQKKITDCFLRSKELMLSIQSIISNAVRLMIVVTCSLLYHIGYSQVDISPKRLDFGTTSPETEWIVDIQIANKSGKTDYLLRHTFSHEYEVLFTSKTLLPDSAITMRVKFIPRMKGNFKENIQLYFASMQEPIILPVTANVQYKNPADNIPCPTFAQRTPNCCSSNQFEVLVIDKETKAPIGKATIKVVEDGTLQTKLETDREGKTAKQIPIGYYQLVASHKDYFPQSVVSYVNPRKSYFKFELERIPEAIAETPKEVIEEEKRDEIIIDGTPEPVLPTPVYSDVLPEDKFKPNNIVFLLDVSGSMSQGDKLELMKGTLRQLTKVLRPSDKITLISYADNSKILLSTTSGDSKGEILTIINELKTSGATSASKGFKTAYDILQKQKIKNGNNQVIVITDGVFNPEDQQQINKLVKKSARKKFITSIMGIKCQAYAVRKLNDVSTFGNGSFLLIEDENDLNIIIDELKKRSAK
jgi:Ca-activated chloride channel family protein